MIIVILLNYKKIVNISTVKGVNKYRKKINLYRTKLNYY